MAGLQDSRRRWPNSVGLSEGATCYAGSKQSRQPIADASNLAKVFRCGIARWHKLRPPAGTPEPEGSPFEWSPYGPRGRSRWPAKSGQCLSERRISGIRSSRRRHETIGSAHHFKMACKVGSVPLSTTILPGLPRPSIRIGAFFATRHAARFTLRDGQPFLSLQPVVAVYA